MDNKRDGSSFGGCTVGTGWARSNGAVGRIGDAARLGVSTKTGEHVDDGSKLNVVSVLSGESILRNSNKSVGTAPAPMGILLGYVASDGVLGASATAFIEARGSFPLRSMGS